MPPSTESSRFRTTDGLTLVHRSWVCEKPRVDLLLVHGYGEHIGRYEQIGRYLSSRGIQLHGYDQRGHGRSDGARVRTPSFDTYARDLTAFVSHLDLPASRPRFLLGHSMGGTVACRYAETMRPPLDGLLLSSPMLRLDLDLPALLVRAALLLAEVVPGLPTVRLDTDLLSHDDAFVESTEADPHYYTGRIPIGTVAAFIRGCRAARRDAQLITLPTLLVHGTADAVTNPEGSRALADAIAHRDVELDLLDDLYHETFNEPAPDGPAVVERWAEWILAHTGA